VVGRGEWDSVPNNGGKMNGMQPSTSSRQGFDPDFGSALNAAAAIRARKISSVELTQHTLRRIDRFQPKLNSFAYLLRDEALSAARSADEALARNEAPGPFHGVPVNVKESFGVAGQPCTWGLMPFKDARAAQHSVAVRRLVDSGAIVVGGTNVPPSLMDAQSFNDIYGTSSNPWDLSRTPGGSSGGTAAALAAGMGFLGIGSDIGGSIRGPASFCGIYGHKPTLDIVSLAGHLPGGMYAAPGFSTLLAVAGPMARTAEDLDAGLRVLAGPESPEAKAWRFELSAPRHQSLRDFRIGYVLEDPVTPVSAETKAVLESAVRACERAGAPVTRGWPAGMNFAEMLDTYYFLLGAFDFSMRPPKIQELTRGQLASSPEGFRKGALSEFTEWQRNNMRRLGYRALWEKYFETTDVFLLPTMFTTAVEHDRTPADTRTLKTPEGNRQPFWDLLTYIVPATITGCPATTAPAGLSRGGLPVGIQIVGPYLEDATPMRFASLLARECGGFQPPPGYGT
jgi:amidase